MVAINMNYVNNNINNYTPANRTPESGEIRYLVYHWTANTSKGATAVANADYYRSGNTGHVGAHYFVDENEIVMSTREKDIAGSVGKWKNSVYITECRNSNSISIEMCPKCLSGKTASQLTGREDDCYFEQGTINNAIELGKYLVEKYHIPKERVIRHADVYGKSVDPRLDDLNYHKWCPLPFFSDMVMKYYGRTGNELWNTFRDYIFSNSSAPYILSDNNKKPTPEPQKGYEQWVGKVVRLVSGDTLSVRVSPNPSSALLADWPRLGNGNMVRIIGEEFAPNNRMWYKIVIAERFTGYVNASYIMPTTGDYVGVVHDAGAYLNVRKTPEQTANNIYTPFPKLGNGNYIRVIGTVGDWDRIRIENGTDFHIAYAHKNYIRKV